MTMEKNIIVKIRDLYFKYPNSNEFALKNINLDIKKGDFVVIGGRSGCGKSTLLYTLNGIIPHAISGEMQGTVSVCGLNTKEHEINELASKVGMVFQNPEAQLFNVTVEDEIAFIAENMNFTRERIVRCVDFALDAIGIRDLRNRYPFELSGGEKQRVAIASAISVKPEILVLDEPTADIDNKGKVMVLDTLNKLNKMGVTIVIAEHDFDEIAKYATRMILLDQGWIVADGNPRDLFLNQIINRLGLRAPQTVEIALKLRNKVNREIPLSVDEAITYFRDYFSKLKTRQINQNLVLKRNKPIIEIRNLSFAYNGKKVLNDINLIINKGEFIGLI